MDKIDWGTPLSNLPVISRECFQRVGAEGFKLVIINGVVHDVSDFILEHPGGSKIMEPYLPFSFFLFSFSFLLLMFYLISVLFLSYILNGQDIVERTLQRRSREECTTIPTLHATLSISTGSVPSTSRTTGRLMRYPHPHPHPHPLSSYPFHPLP